MLSRAYLGKYFYVGSQSTLQMLIKSLNLVESLPCAPCPYYFVSATCTMLQVDLPEGSGFGTQGHLPAHLALSCFCRSVALLFQVCFGWLVGAREAETMPL